MKGFLSRISINPERRFKRNVRYRKTSRTRQAAGAGKHPPEAAARYIWAERSVYAAVRGDDAGGYVLVAVVSFAAAVAITALCFRLRIRENRKKGGADKPNRHEQEEKSQ